MNYANKIGELARWLARGALGLGLLLVAGGPLSSTAFAYVPSSILIQAIAAKRNAIASSEPLRWNYYLANELVGPDTIPGSDGTPDGIGAFSFYTGSGGLGAIYAYQVGNAADARAVTAAVLAAWGAAGYENGYGYPIDDYHFATRDERNRGCKPYDNAQTFYKFPTWWDTDHAWIACHGDGITWVQVY